MIHDCEMQLGYIFESTDWWWQNASPPWPFGKSKADSTALLALLAPVSKTAAYIIAVSHRFRIDIFRLATSVDTTPPTEPTTTTTHNHKPHPATMSFIYGPPPPAQPQQFRHPMVSEKIFELHIIKSANTDSPTIHTFPIDAGSLPEISLRHIRTLTSTQLIFLANHLETLNDSLAAQRKQKADAAAAAAAAANTLPEAPIETEATPKPEAHPINHPYKSPPFLPGTAPFVFPPRPSNTPSPSLEEDFETLWVLEGIDLECEPETLWCSTMVPPRRRYVGGKTKDLGVKTWKPIPGVQTEIVAVYSRNVCARNNAYSPQRGVYRDVEPYMTGNQPEVWEVQEVVREKRNLVVNGRVRSPSRGRCVPDRYSSDSDEEVLVM